MDPLLDEKAILVLSQIIPEYFFDQFEIHFRREAFGPSINEGICFDFCASIRFSGSMNGFLFLGMDGATKLKLIPYIGKHYTNDLYQKGMANSLLLETLNQIVSLLSTEFSYANVTINIESPEIRNHKVFMVDIAVYRQYVLIFNIYKGEMLLGRSYFILLLEKDT